MNTPDLQEGAARREAEAKLEQERREKIVLENLRRFDRAMQRVFKGIYSRPVRRSMMFEALKRQEPSDA